MHQERLIRTAIVSIIPHSLRNTSSASRPPTSAHAEKVAMNQEPHADVSQHPSESASEHCSTTVLPPNEV